MIGDVPSFIESAQDVSHPRLRDLFEYWSSIGPVDGLRLYRQFDPTLVSPQVLPHVAVIERSGDGLDYRFRLAGTHIDDFVGTPLRNVSVSQAPLQERERIISALQLTTEHNRPQYFEYYDGGPEALFRTVFQLMLPMSMSGAAAEIVVAGILADRPNHEHRTLRDLFPAECESS